VVVTVEEIVEELRAPPNACVLPQWVISAVALVPGGAFPSYALGYYERDNRFYKAWNGIARDRGTFMEWMQRHILQTADFAEFRRTLEDGVHEEPRS
jgi:glutaconate CoA-transferase subunit A